ncbi:prostasin [Drosophila eugracilis]|uniref:prostasin n=1 Tax=Drosophila eugracilis TaxID=29029 RepID=UPI0007E6FB1D|nr:prostasin [Drosophila eugracilis]
MKATVFRIFLLLLFLSHHGASEFLEKSCSRSNGVDINDVNAATWMAAIITHSQFVCSGTIIHKRFVLTSAHCLDNDYNLSVLLGAYHIKRYTTRYNVIQKIKHDQYDRWNKFNDIGLLKLDNSIIYDDEIQPLCIFWHPQFKRTVDGAKNFYASGWDLKHGVEKALVQTLILDQRSRNECYEKFGLPLTSQICTKVRKGDTCWGDSGGPLITVVQSTHAQYAAQVGIISYGEKACDGLGVYTDITSHFGWIREKVNDVDRPLFSQPPGYFPPKPQRVSRMLFNDCGGKSMSSIIRPSIYGPGFEALGVLITDRFVITVATDLPKNSANLEVGVVMNDQYDVYEVDSILKPSGNADDYNYDIAILKLKHKATENHETMKPICMLAHVVDLNDASASSQPFLLIDPLKTIEFSVKHLTYSDCSNYLGSEIKPNQYCVEEPEGISDPNDIRNYLLVTKIMNEFVLLGIYGYSSDNIHVFSNVLRYTDWIGTKIHEVSLSNNDESLNI